MWAMIGWQTYVYSYFSYKCWVEVTFPTMAAVIINEDLVWIWPVRSECWWAGGHGWRALMEWDWRKVKEPQRSCQCLTWEGRGRAQIDARPARSTWRWGSNLFRMAPLPLWTTARLCHHFNTPAKFNRAVFWSFSHRPFYCFFVLLLTKVGATSQAEVTEVQELIGRRLCWNNQRGATDCPQNPQDVWNVFLFLNGHKETHLLLLELINSDQKIQLWNWFEDILSTWMTLMMMVV